MVARRLLNASVFGAGVGLALFVAELVVLLVSGGAAGLALDTSGPFAALLAAAKPALPWLLARVLIAYVLSGATVGFASAVLAEAWPFKVGAARTLVLVLENTALWLLLIARHEVMRPALFDDVAFMRPLVRWAVATEPWVPLVAGAVWALVHVAFLARSRWARRALAFSLLPLAFTVLGGMTNEAQAVGRRSPLLVLIGVDALRPDRLGRGVTPNLDAFVARDATLFTRAYTPIAQTEPAWRSLVTARWPHIAGSRYPLTPQSSWPTLPTMPATLNASGFSTVFETDCSRFNFQSDSSGFAVRRQPPRGALNFALERLRFRLVGVVADNALGAWWLPELVENRAVAGIHDPMGYAERLAARVVDTAKRGPTLYAFHATAAHFPGDPTYPYYRRYVSAEAPLERRLRMVFSPIANGAATPVPGWGRAEAEALYDELLAQADAQVGVLLRALNDAGRYDDAYVMVFSDHGESFHRDVPALAGATPVHGARLSDEENRIVLALKVPGERQVSRDEHLVRLIDIGPTLLEAAGVPPLPHADGRSLLPLLRGEPLEEQLLLYAETGFTHASPAAFDPSHLARAPRSFDAYRVLPDGVVELTAQAHQAVLGEKDVGAFDGEHWLVRAPQTDGTVSSRCDGNCEQLTDFLDRTLREGAP